MQNNPDFKSADAHLLYARTLDAQGALEEAEHEYAAAAPGYPGAEARLRYALLLKRRGKLEEARRILKDLLDGAKLGSGALPQGAGAVAGSRAARIGLEYERIRSTSQ